MRRWLEVLTHRADNVLKALIIVVLFGATSVLTRYVIEYWVNSNRPVEYWVTYLDVQPAFRSFKIGVKPVFVTKAIWHRDIEVSWPDVMWCVSEEGKFKGINRRYASNGGNIHEMKHPGLVGFYDQHGLMPGSMSGYWQWSGDVPSYPSECHLQPTVIIYPSPQLKRDVPVAATHSFRFEKTPTAVPR